MRCFHLHVSRPCLWASVTCALLAIVKSRCSQRSLAADAFKAYVFPMEASNTPKMARLGFTVHQRKKKLLFVLYNRLLKESRKFMSHF